MLDDLYQTCLNRGVITKSQVLKHFGSAIKAGEFFGITDKAVYQWDDTGIPRERELELMLRLPEKFGAPQARERVDA